MSDMVPLYGFGGSGGSGGTLTVTAPAGVTVTVNKDRKTKAKTAGSDGLAVFRGLASGDWTVTITDGTQTAQKTVTVTTDYAVEMTFFSATIHITYPAGAVCTATDGVTTLTAPDTGGVWDCIVPNVGTWVVSLNSGYSETVAVTEDAQTFTIDRWYLYDNGVDRTELTGRFTAKGIKYTASNPCTASSPTATAASDSVTLKQSASWKCGLWHTTNKVDLTGFSTLFAVVSNVSVGSEGDIGFSVHSGYGSYYENNILAEKWFSAGSGKKTVELDISGITGAQYVSFYILSGTSGVSCKIYEFGVK